MLVATITSQEVIIVMFAFVLHRLYTIFTRCPNAPPACESRIPRRTSRRPRPRVKLPDRFYDSDDEAPHVNVTRRRVAHSARCECCYPTVRPYPDLVVVPNLVRPTRPRVVQPEQRVSHRVRWDSPTCAYSDDMKRKVKKVTLQLTSDGKVFKRIEFTRKHSTPRRYSRAQGRPSAHDEGSASAAGARRPLTLRFRRRRPAQAQSKNVHAEKITSEQTHAQQAQKQQSQEQQTQEQQTQEQQTQAQQTQEQQTQEQKTPTERTTVPQSAVRSGRDRGQGLEESPVSRANAEASNSSRTGVKRSAPSLAAWHRFRHPARDSPDSFESESRPQDSDSKQVSEFGQDSQQYWGADENCGADQSWGSREDGNSNVNLGSSSISHGHREAETSSPPLGQHVASVTVMSDGRDSNPEINVAGNPQHNVGENTSEAMQVEHQDSSSSSNMSDVENPVRGFDIVMPDVETSQDRSPLLLDRDNVADESHVSESQSSSSSTSASTMDRLFANRTAQIEDEERAAENRNRNRVVENRNESESSSSSSSLPMSFLERLQMRRMLRNLGVRRENQAVENRDDNSVVENRDGGGVTENRNEDRVTENRDEGNSIENQDGDNTVGNRDGEGVVESRDEGDATENRNEGRVPENREEDNAVENQDGDGATESRNEDHVTENRHENNAAESRDGDNAVENRGGDPISETEDENTVSGNVDENTAGENEEGDAVVENEDEDAIDENEQRGTVVENEDENAIGRDENKDESATDQNEDTSGPNQERDAVNENGEENEIVENTDQLAANEESANSVSQEVTESNAPNEEARSDDIQDVASPEVNRNPGLADVSVSAEIEYFSKHSVPKLNVHSFNVVISIENSSSVDDYNIIRYKISVDMLSRRGIQYNPRRADIEPSLIHAKSTIQHKLIFTVLGEVSKSTPTIGKARVLYELQKVRHPREKCLLLSRILNFAVRDQLGSSSNPNHPDSWRYPVSRTGQEARLLRFWGQPTIHFFSNEERVKVFVDDMCKPVGSEYDIDRLRSMLSYMMVIRN